MSGTVRLLTLASMVLCALVLAACGSSSSSTTGSSSGTEESTSPGTSTSTEEASTSTEVPTTTESKFLDGYTGPDSKLPTEYDAPEVKSGTKFTIGFINPFAAIESLNNLEKAAEEQTKLMGGTFISKDSRGEIDQEVSNFDQLLAQHVDAIVCYPIDPHALSPSLAKAEKEGIPVIAADLNDDTSQPLLKGFTSQVIVGRDYGSYVVSKTLAAAEPGAKVGLITIGAPVPAFAYQLERLEAYAKEDGLAVVGTEKNGNDQPSGATQAMNALMSESPEMNGTIAYNDLTGLTAAGAARAANREISVVSFNGEAAAQEAVAGGAMLGTFMVDWVGIGSQAVQGAYNVITNQNLPLPETLVRPGWMLTEENAGTFPTTADQLQELAESK